MTPQEAVTALAKAISVGWRGREEERTGAVEALAFVETALSDLATLVPIGRMFLDALDDGAADDLPSRHPEAMAAVREAVERGEAR